MNRRFVLLGLATTFLAAMPLSTSAAQRETRGGGMPRAQMERTLQRRLANLLRTQLGLNDEQMRQLSDVNQRFDQQRRELMRRELLTRRGLRAEVLRGDSAEAPRIEQLLTDQFRIERERIDLTEAEQRDLAKFLTPVQRAKYLGVQEQMRREMDQLRLRMMPPGIPADSAIRRGRRPPPSTGFHG